MESAKKKKKNTAHLSVNSQAPEGDPTAEEF